MLHITMNKGFQMNFENGYTISVQFGQGNYCENYMNEKYPPCSSERTVSSKDAKIAIWKRTSKRDFVTGEVLKSGGFDFEGDGQVCGWLSADDVAKVIAYLVTL